MSSTRTSNDSLRRQIFHRRQATPSSRHRHIKPTTFAAYAGIFLMIMSLVAMSYVSPQKATKKADIVSNTYLTQTSTAAAADQLLATNLAANMGERAGLPAATSVANLYQSMEIESSMAQVDTDSSVTTKQQIIATTATSRTIQKYTTVAGDTIVLVAARYNISAQTVRWSNNLTNDAVDAGKELIILPVDGILYTVKNGDTIDSIATKYSADKTRIASFNDTELTGIKTGQQLTIPGGVLPENERPGYVAPRVAVSTTTNTTTTYTNNAGAYGGGSTWKSAYAWSGSRAENYGYPFGQCTWYAAIRRAELGNPVGRAWGNGGSWHYGRTWDRNPQVGDVMDGQGHVAIVEAVDPGVAIYISEMNGYRWGGGWGRVGFGVVPWNVATSGSFYYVK